MPTKKKGHDTCNAFSAAQKKLETSRVTRFTRFCRKAPFPGKQRELLLEECSSFEIRSKSADPRKSAVDISIRTSPGLLAFRSSLKKEVEGIANREGHSVAQICEALLLAGSDAYKKQGGKFVKRALA